MPSMIAFERGDVVLVEYVYVDESGRKVRPAVIISADTYNHARQEIVVAAITSNVSRQLVGDYLIGDWRGAGLARPSVVTGIVWTIRRSMIQRRLGALADPDREAISQTLRQMLGL